jgi:ribokinase
MNPRVFVLGNFVQACCWNVPRLPNAGETLVATGVHIEPGGKGLNVAVCLQRLGAEVTTMIGCGSDAAGTELLKLLKTEGLSAKHIHQFEGASGWGSGWIATDGQNAIAVYPGANLLLNHEHVALASDAIAQSQLVYGQFETSIPAVQAAFRLAHSRGVTTVLNPSPWQTPPSELQLSTHTVIVNETEAHGLLATIDELHGTPLQCFQQIANHLADFWRKWPNAHCLVVTLGAKGSLGFERGQRSTCWHVSAPTITAIDTVGAGDAFASGYCAARLAGKDFKSALRWGNVCGAYLASKAGVLGALPGSARLEQLLQNEASTLVDELSLK